MTSTQHVTRGLSVFFSWKLPNAIFLFIYFSFILLQSLQLQETEITDMMFTLDSILVWTLLIINHYNFIFCNIHAQGDNSIRCLRLL